MHYNIHLAAVTAHSNFDGGRIAYGLSMFREIVAASPHSVLTHLTSHTLPITLLTLLQAQSQPSSQPPPSPSLKKIRQNCNSPWFSKLAVIQLILWLDDIDDDLVALGTPENHLHAVILCALRLIQAEVPATASSEMHESNKNVQNPRLSESLSWLICLPSRFVGMRLSS